MDVAEFKSRLLLTRTWEADAEGAKFALRMPSDQDVARILERHREGDEAIASSEFPVINLELALLLLIGWQGVNGRMLDPGGKFAGEVPYDAEFARYLLEGNVGLCTTLTNSYWERRRERDSKREENQKNSARASTTSEV
jgi:hypothetical protein